MAPALVLQLQGGLSRQNLQQIIHLCRACYDDDPLLYGLCYALVLSLLDRWEDDETIDLDRYNAIQMLHRPLLDLIQTPRAESTLWIAHLETVFRAWKQTTDLEAGHELP